jgi:hypothetical protein
MCCERVIAIDINEERLRMAQHNARVYGVHHKIDFIAGDFFALAPQLRGDVVFLSPPWGGPSYRYSDACDLRSMPVDSIHAIETALQITPNVCAVLPRNSDMASLQSRLPASLSFEVELNYLDQRLKTLTCYFGTLEQPLGAVQWRSGAVCQARYSLDSCFYRATIVQTDSARRTCLVHYSEYGNVEWLPWSELRELRE